MAFYAANFIYNGIMSSEYGLRITSNLEEGIGVNVGADVELKTESLYRRPKEYLLGVQQTPVLQLPVEISVLGELSAAEDSVVSNWLFGNMNYKKLQIVQPDMQYVYYNCIFTGKNTNRTGNIITGYTAVIYCDSPFAWEFPKTITYDYGGNTYVVNDDIKINNTSDNADYTYPTVVFKMNIFGGDLSIINSDDDDREFLFEDLSPSETVTVDNDLQIITTNKAGVNRLENFVQYDGNNEIIDATSYKWMRYVKGVNNLAISGNIETIAFTHQFAKKMS
jgi:hypothetical protein